MQSTRGVRKKMSVRTALLMLTVLVVVQAAVALPAGVIIEERRRGSCDKNKKCVSYCEDSARKAQKRAKYTIRGNCLDNECECWLDGVPFIGLCDDVPHKCLRFCENSARRAHKLVKNTIRGNCWGYECKCWIDGAPWP